MSDPRREAFENWFGGPVETRDQAKRLEAWLAALKAKMPPEICQKGHPLACLESFCVRHGNDKDHTEGDGCEPLKIWRCFVCAAKGGGK